MTTIVLAYAYSALATALTILAVHRAVKLGPPQHKPEGR
jgi:hypothetical protein